ncbi:hypothetical protein BJ979_000161 [Schumannella luteola]|uniref:Uncharacterized protein n=1 Tax=Schumannella luteola TaxID=472059 RepID=A0A852YK08_9MICO|nr:hypothetical protein [Schumannella luteola]
MTWSSTMTADPVVILSSPGITLATAASTLSEGV